VGNGALPGPDSACGWRIISKLGTVTAMCCEAATIIKVQSSCDDVNRGKPMPNLPISPYVLPILLLIGSNVFMTIAWYGHLRFKEVPLFGVILASWGIAFIEYCLAVPANRWGSAVYSTAQLKTVQEIITLVVFAAFSVIYLREPFTWNYAAGFVLIAIGAYFIFAGPFGRTAM
jgi:uncharacterized protein (DUF486 family)